MRALRIILAGLLLTGLAACGFKPLYGTPMATGAVPHQHFAATQVQIIPGRLGHAVYSELQPRLHPNGTTDTTRYRLIVLLDERQEGLATEQDETYTRYDVRVSARYQLEDIKGTVLTGGETRTTTAYNVVDSPFATHVGQGDARRRAATLLAEDIVLRLGLYFDKLDAQR